MNKLFHIIIFSFAITSLVNAQNGLFNPKELSNGAKGVIYDKEIAGNLRLLSNGFEVGVTIGKIKTYYKTQYWQFGIGELKHNREFKNRDGITGGNSIGRNSRSYIFGCLLYTSPSPRDRG